MYALLPAAATTVIPTKIAQRYEIRAEHQLPSRPAIREHAQPGRSERSEHEPREEEQ